MNKFLPTSTLAKRICDIFHRKHSTPWQPKEKRAFLAIRNAIEESDLRNIERRYGTLWPPNTGKNSLRHDLYTFLNNYAGETDRANIWAEQHPEKTIRKVIPLPLAKTEPFQPPTDPEEIAALEKFNAARKERSVFRACKKEMGR